jgi:hypothetical protein
MRLQLDPDYSASSDINVASTSFAGCCVFVIHLLDIPCIKLVGNKIGDKKDEKEIIFLGTFYKNKELTEEGFLEIGLGHLNKTMFECCKT